MDSSINWDDINDTVKEFSLNGETHHGKVVSVYDGDTIKVVFPIYKRMYKWNCRLNRVDTPELRTKSDTEKKYGYYVRDQLRDKILNKVVRVECKDYDKYGRLLSEIFIEDENVNNWLISNEYAFEYNGGTKQSWEDYLSQKPQLLDKC